VSQQTVVTHSYPDILSQNPNHDKYNKCRPPKVKQSGQYTEVKTHDGNCKKPN
jgi:hypothetical protein